MSHLLPDDRSPRVEEITRIVLRPLATPLPLGFLALAIGSILLSAVQLHWIGMQYMHQVATVMLVLVTPLELATCLLAFFVRDVVMATALGLLTGSWAAVGTLLVTAPGGSTRNPVLGVLAIAVAVTLLVPATTVSTTKPAGAVIVVVAAARFALTGIYQLGAGPTWQTASGVVGVVLVGFACYSSLAFAIEDARHHPVLPISRRSTSAAAMSGELQNQLDDLASEAGVRQES
jgi:uncharacterized protein